MLAYLLVVRVLPAGRRSSVREDATIWGVLWCGGRDGVGKRNQGGQPNPMQVEASRAWHAACELYRHIASGRPLVPIPSMMVLQQGEVPFGEVVLEYSRFYSMDVQAQQNSGFYFGSTAFVAAGLIGDAVANSNARARAASMSQAQWRFNAPVPVVVTSQRTLTMFEGQWIEFAHEAVLAFYPEPQNYTFVLTFGVTSPLRLTGPWAPWASLMVAVGIYGLERVPTLPAFDVFRQQTAQAIAAEAPQRPAITQLDEPDVTEIDPDITRPGG